MGEEGLEVAGAAEAGAEVRVEVGRGHTEGALLQRLQGRVEGSVETHGEPSVITDGDNGSRQREPLEESGLITCSVGNSAGTSGKRDGACEHFCFMEWLRWLSALYVRGRCAMASARRRARVEKKCRPRGCRRAAHRRAAWRRSCCTRCNSSSPRRP